MIHAWAERSEDMIGGAIDGTVQILAELRASGVPCYVLSNMEPETFPLRLQRFDFLHWFDGHVISGLEGLVKPDPALFHRMLRRFDLEAQRTVFIDDSAVNVGAAAALGIHAIHFTSAARLRADLERLELLANL
jgi:2-haloacid dehalogenase